MNRSHKEMSETPFLFTRLVFDLSTVRQARRSGPARQVALQWNFRNNIKVFMEIYNWLKEDLDSMIESLKKDLTLIANKKKDDEWKRDHYRYTFTIAAQRIYKLLNTTITENPPAVVQPSTKKELEVLKEIVEQML